MILIILAPKAGGQDDDHDFNYHDDSDYHYYIYQNYLSLHLRQATALVNDNASRGSRQRRHLHLGKNTDNHDALFIFSDLLGETNQNLISQIFSSA